jgi:hypothetical protein
MIQRLILSFRVYENYIYLIFIIFSALFGLVIGLYFFLLIKKLKLKSRFNHAKRGEEQAKHYLKRHGFKILASQVQMNTEIQIDNVKYSYLVKADYLVKKGHKKAIIEVKTGEKAIDPLSVNTRRQLFEYTHIYKVDEVYLFDAEHDLLKKIVFPSEQNYSNHFSALMFIIFMLQILLIGLFIFTVVNME